MLYTDETCWEFFCGKTTVLDRLRASLTSKPLVEVYASRAEDRQPAFRSAGLLDVWRAMYPR
jgi:hypothetical protein